MLIKYNLKGNHLFVIYNVNYNNTILSLYIFHCSIFNGYPGMQCGKIFVVIFFFQKKRKKIKNKFIYTQNIYFSCYFLILFYCGLQKEFFFIIQCAAIQRPNVKHFFTKNLNPLDMFLYLLRSAINTGCGTWVMQINRVSWPGQFSQVNFQTGLSTQTHIVQWLVIDSQGCEKPDPSS